MNPKTALTFAALMGVFSSAPVNAQSTSAEASPTTGGTSAAIRILTTAPILRNCTAYPLGGSCFRVSFRISPKASGVYKIGYLNRWPWVHETKAYAATGAVCRGYAIAGLPYGGVPGDNVMPDQFRWFQEPFEVSIEKPATFIVEFACDDKLIAGDNITMQMSIVVDGGRRVEFARYSVPEMQIVAAR